MITPGIRFNVCLILLGDPLPAGHTQLTHSMAKIQNALAPPLGIQCFLNRRHTPHTHSQSEGDTPKHSHIGGTYQHTPPVHFHTAWDHCY